MSRWNWYWLIWFSLSFAAFLGPEVYALITNWRNTLSASVWDLEEFRQGQPITQWTFGHLAFVGLLALLFVWLLGHFAMGWWR